MRGRAIYAHRRHRLVSIVSPRRRRLADQGCPFPPGAYGMTAIAFLTITVLQGDCALIFYACNSSVVIIPSCLFHCAGHWRGVRSAYRSPSVRRVEA